MDVVTIGKACRQVRKAAGLTLYQVPGIHPTSLSIIELDKREPSLEEIRTIARAAGVDPVALGAHGLRNGTIRTKPLRGGKVWSKPHPPKRGTQKALRTGGERKSRFTGRVSRAS